MMEDRWLDKPRAAGGRPVVQRLAIGAGLLAIGLLALTQTMRFAPWSLWRLVWPVAVLAAGVLLVGYGGRNMRLAGVALTVLGGFFLLGVVWSLFWSALNVLWPFALIFAGLAILAAGVRAWRGTGDEG